MSAVAFINKIENTITVKAHLFFYGKYAEPTLGQRIIDEINTFWNDPKAKMPIGDSYFDVSFDVNFEIMDHQQALVLIPQNTSFENNYIRIEDKNIAERSMMGFGLGENSGHWLIGDQLGESTTAAHEFGHALGLPHPALLDFRFSGHPPIMAPRGTLVDADFQWNPLAEPGMPGGTMKPIHRRVRQSEVIDIFKDHTLDENDFIKIGTLTNYIFDEIGRPAALTFQ